MPASVSRTGGSGFMARWPEADCRRSYSAVYKPSIPNVRVVRRLPAAKQLHDKPALQFPAERSNCVKIEADCESRERGNGEATKWRTLEGPII
jgi:hypothetical protein